MSDDREQVVPSVVVRVARPEHPVAAVADDDEARRGTAYPAVRAGGPLFGHAADLGDGRWRVHSVEEDTPQAARDALAHRLRKRLAMSTDAMLAAELAAVGQVLDWEKVNEVTVAGRRHRVVRADTFARFSEDGPEPPRPSDPDTGTGGQSRDEGVVVDPGSVTGPAQALTRVELLTAYYPSARVPAEVYADSVAAIRSHPDGVLLPTEYAVSELVGGGWEPVSHHHASPQAARDQLCFKFRYMMPRFGQLGEEEIAAYGRAADKVDATRANEVTVLGRRFRVTRVIALLRFGMDGPEPPRASDYDPEPPPEAHFSDLRARGLLPEPQ
ncbi:DUF5954 family protein [Micromonospora sp. NPDC050980]|uniref:DUF5954 family protein n=1 Tax=Micromonospora sp. NPDC050980 TaxID=3155161 RepID=UPI0034005913